MYLLCRSSSVFSSRLSSATCWHRHRAWASTTPAPANSLPRPLLDHPSINATVYDSDAALQSAVERGSEEVGLSLPAGFAAALESDSAEVDFTVYRWGEAGVRNLLLLESVVARAMTEGIGSSIDQLPVTVNAEQIGAANTQTWSQRLLPLLLIMAIVLGGLFFPAASLLDEKKNRTLVALTSTPTSLLDVYLSKTLIGFILSGIMGTIILLINSAFAGQVALLLLVIALGGLMSSAFGIVLGSVSKDMDTFLGIVKAVGILLYGARHPQDIPTGARVDWPPLPHLLSDESAA